MYAHAHMRIDLYNTYAYVYAGLMRARIKKLEMSVIWNTSRCVSPRCLSFCTSCVKRFSMSYNPYKKRGGGPNRGGGRGGRGRGGRGGGRGGRGGGPPQGLSGREIGMFYRQKSQAKKEEKEKNEVWTALVYM